MTVSDSRSSAVGGDHKGGGGTTLQQQDSESVEDREFRQAVQARRRSPLDASSSYRSTASSDDSSDPDNPAASPGASPEKARWTKSNVGQHSHKQRGR